MKRKAYQIVGRVLGELRRVIQFHETANDAKLQVLKGCPAGTELMDVHELSVNEEDALRAGWMPAVVHVRIKDGRVKVTKFGNTRLIIENHDERLRVER